jgi:hypothetical protein
MGGSRGRSGPGKSKRYPARGPPPSPYRPSRPPVTGEVEVPAPIGILSSQKVYLEQLPRVLVC